VPAKKGNSVLFWDLNPSNEGDNRAMHGSDPVKKGVKWAMTKWIRENKFWRYEDNLSEREKKIIEEEDIQFVQQRAMKLKALTNKLE